MERVTAALSGVLMPIFLLLAGLYFTVTVGRYFFVHPGQVVRGLRSASGAGGVSPWRRLSLALAGTLGVGNITGVALAVALGGAGALFWMWVSAFVAMFLKYAEILLAHRTRVWGRDEAWHGGAMYYMKKYVGGHLGRALAGVFAVLCVAAALTLGGVVQTAAAAESLRAVFGVAPAVTGAVFAIFGVLLLWRGIGGVERVTSLLIPLLCGGYLLLSLLGITRRAEVLPEVFLQIFRGAFSARSALGGGVGYLSLAAVRYGISRGLVSNEAGCGTSPIVHAGSSVRAGAAQGIFGVVEVAVDTLVLCTVTGLVLLCSGVAPSAGSDYAIRAFSELLGAGAAPFLAASIALFAFATVLCWGQYGAESLGYLTGSKAAHGVLFAALAAALFFGAVGESALLWSLTDLVLAVMTLLNLATLLLARKDIKRETKEFFER